MLFKLMMFLCRRAAGGPRKLICVNPCYLWIVLLILLTGCNQAKTGGDVIRSTVEKDGISLTLSRSQEALTTVELLRLTLDVKAPQGSEFYFPNAETDFGDFSYFESHITSMKLNTENKVEQKYSLVLEPGLPGSHTVPVLTVQYGQQSISTEPFKIEVGSILPAERTEIRDITSLDGQPVKSLMILILLIPGLILIVYPAVFWPKKAIDLNFAEIAKSKLVKSEVTEMPKIFCEFLSHYFNEKIAYTGTESLVKYLCQQKLDNSIRFEIENFLLEYERNRFTADGSFSREQTGDSFIHLIQKLEGKS